MGLAAIFLVVGAFSVLLVAIRVNEASQNRSSSNENPAQKCLSGWDGMHGNLNAAIKKELKDPDSFEHVKTVVVPEDDGRGTIVVRFRARNSFGAPDFGSAMGKIDLRSCRVVEWAFAKG